MMTVGAEDMDGDSDPGRRSVGGIRQPQNGGAGSETQGSKNHVGEASSRFELEDRVLDRSRSRYRNYTRR